MATLEGVIIDGGFMSILLFLIIGGLVGWAAATLLGRDEGLAGSVVIGIIGAFIGSFVSRFFTGTNQSYLSLNLGNLFWAFIGALIFVGILNLFSRSHDHAM
jgi:uncharacterized membrane protein YeaQ/YmgE (transglycosylase-associated protein family)